MSKFLVLYLIPAAVIDDWKNTDFETRKPAEDRMRAQWGAWLGEHGSAVLSTESAGRTRRVSADGVSDARNDLVLYSIVEAESHEAATTMFEDHPHLQIPQSSIEIMEVKAMGHPGG